MNMNEIQSDGSLAEARLSEPFIDKREVARRLGRTVRSVENWMRRGLLPFYKCNQIVVFRWSEIQTHMKENLWVCRQVDPTAQREGHQ